MPATVPSITSRHSLYARNLTVFFLFLDFRGPPSAAHWYRLGYLLSAEHAVIFKSCASFIGD